MKPLKVLIVEDDPLVALDLEEIVARRPGAVAIVSGSAREAEKLLESPVDVALLDIDVRDGKTFGLADRLKQNRIDFVFVSGSSPKEVPHELRDVPFIAKPYDPREISRLLAGREGPEAN